MKYRLIWAGINGPGESKPLAQMGLRRESEPKKWGATEIVLQ
jgi:hypothetical protein